MPLSGTAARWAFALLVLGLTVALNFWIQSVTAARAPFLPFFPALIVIAYAAGLGPGLVALAAATLAVPAFWMERLPDAWPPWHAPDLVALALFAVAGGAVVAISARLARLLGEAQRTRARLDLALEAGRMTAWEWDVRSNRVSMSDSAAKVFGTRWDRLDGAWSIAHPDDRDLIRSSVAAALASGSEYTFLSRVIRPDTGETRWIETRGYVHRTPDGAAERVTGITVDVTEQQRALTDLREAESKALRLATVIEGTPDFVGIVRPDGTLAYMNPAGRRLLGIPDHADLAAYRHAQLCPPWVYERTQTEWLPQALAHGSASGEGALLALDGREIPVSFVMTAQRDERGELEYLSTLAHDLTERRSADLRLGLALRAGRMYAWEHERDSGNVRVSATAAEILGRTWHSAAEAFALAHPDDVARVGAVVGNAIARGEPYACEFRVRHATEDRELWIEMRGQPQRDAAGRVVRVIGVCTDVTERKRVEEQLQLESRRKDEFLATLAHELRNPMAPIRYAAAALTDGALPAVVAQSGAIIERQAAQMARLLDDLLDMSRITRDVIELERATLDLRELLREAVETARPTLNGLQHRLCVAIPPAPVWVGGDGTRLLQVIGNLLDNAAKYNDPGGRVDVRLDVEGGQAVLRVADTGIGLAPEMLPRVFDLFSQVHRSLKVAKGGLGIGLAVVKRLVELHGGTIAVRSAGLGRGAEFTVRLPLAVAPALAAPAATGGRIVDLFDDRPRVLVVDDNRDAADSLAMLLRAEHYPVSVAYDGRSALEAFPATRPDVVLLDVGLPDVSGLDVARELKSRATAPLTIVAITGWGQDHDRERTRRAGMEHHLVKPVDPAALLQLLEALDRHAGRRGSAAGMH